MRCILTIKLLSTILKMLNSQNTNRLPPKPNSSFRHLRQSIQEFRGNYDKADKAANNAVVVCRLHSINSLQQELNDTEAYEETCTDEVGN